MLSYSLNPCINALLWLTTHQGVLEAKRTFPAISALITCNFPAWSGQLSLDRYEGTLFFCEASFHQRSSTLSVKQPKNAGWVAASCMGYATSAPSHQLCPCFHDVVLFKPVLLFPSETACQTVPSTSRCKCRQLVRRRRVLHPVYSARAMILLRGIGTFESLFIPRISSTALKVGPADSKKGPLRCLPVVTDDRCGSPFCRR